PYVALESPLSATIAEAYDRKARGDQYYIGPTCPQETLEKLGIDPEMVEASRGLPSRPPPPMAGGLTEPDRLPRIEELPPLDSLPGYDQLRPNESQETPGVTAQGTNDEVAVEDFGDLNSELSVVTDLPVQSPVGEGAKKGTILVVHDEPEIRRMLEKLLSGN